MWELFKCVSIILEVEMMLFLVGAFSLKEKSPTLTVSSFFFCFFSVDNLTLSGPLFLQSLFTFVQLTFWEAGDRVFDSRTKPQIFYASKSRCETKALFRFVWFFSFFFRHYATFFSKIFGIYQLHFFWSFRFVKTFNEPEWPLFEFFGIVRLSKKILFFEKKISIFFWKK